MVEPQPGRTGNPRDSIVRWLVLASGVFAGTFEAISVHATLSGLRPTSSYLGFALFLGLGFGAATLIASGAARRRVLAKAGIVVSVVAVVGSLAIPGRIAEAQGALPPGIPVGQTALLFLFQLGWAVTYWLTVEGRSTAKGRQMPAALGTVLLFGGGILLGKSPGPTATSAPEEPSAVYERSPTAEDLAFATQTETAGEGRGSEFAHYHTGMQPLIGLSFSTKEWFRRNRIADDLTAVFDRENVPDAVHQLIAPDGYVLAGIEVQADENVSALRVQFAPFDGTFVSPFDRYWTEWYGGHERADRGIRLDGGSIPVVGVRGTSGLVLTSLSLLIAK